MSAPPPSWPWLMASHSFSEEYRVLSGKTEQVTEPPESFSTSSAKVVIAMPCQSALEALAVKIRSILGSPEAS